MNVKKCKFVGLIVFTIAIILPSPTPAIGAESASDVPAFILSGLNTYKAKGPAAALIVWTNGSSLENNQSILKMTELFNKVESLYGNYVDYALVKSTSIAENSKLVCIQMNFKKGPAFCRFLCYRLRPTDPWILAGTFIVNTEPGIVLNDSYYPSNASSRPAAQKS